MYTKWNKQSFLWLFLPQVTWLTRMLFWFYLRRRGYLTQPSILLNFLQRLMSKWKQEATDRLSPGQLWGLAVRNTPGTLPSTSGSTGFLMWLPPSTMTEPNPWGSLVLSPVSDSLPPPNRIFQLIFPVWVSLTMLVDLMLTNTVNSPSSLDMVLQSFNPHTQEAEASATLWVPGQPELHKKKKKKILSQNTKKTTRKSLTRNKMSPSPTSKCSKTS